MITYKYHSEEVQAEGTSENQIAWYYEVIMRAPHATFRGYGVTLNEALVDLKRRVRDGR